MYLNVDFSESVLDISVFRHLFNKTVEREDLWSELHASPHIHIWIGHTHIWIYMDKTIWENALYVG